jgi:hypothetical protein
MVLPAYAPMIPTQVPEPFHRDGWVYDEKVDGWRILAYKETLEQRGRTMTSCANRAALAVVLLLIASVGTTLVGHLKTGHTWTGQIRP